jgi:hypothetical protein
MNLSVLIIVVGIGVLALFCFGLLLVSLCKDMRGLTVESLRIILDTVKVPTQELSRAIEYFSPLRDIPCKSCGGTGKVEKENELVKAIMETLRSKEKRHR